MSTGLFYPEKSQWSNYRLLDSLNVAFMIGNDKPLRNPPSLFKTPPYVTARPVVTHRKMSLSASDGSPPSQKSIRFLVLATDGLWDELRYYYYLRIMYQFEMPNITYTATMKL